MLTNSIIYVGVHVRQVSSVADESLEGVPGLGGPLAFSIEISREVNLQAGLCV